MAARHQLDQIIAGDILHHPPAVLHHLPRAGRQSAPQQRIAARAPPAPGADPRHWPPPPRRWSTPRSRPRSAPQIRRLEGQPLPLGRPTPPRPRPGACPPAPPASARGFVKHARPPARHVSSTLPAPADPRVPPPAPTAAPRPPDRISASSASVAGRMPSSSFQIPCGGVRGDANPGRLSPRAARQAASGNTLAGFNSHPGRTHPSPASAPPDRRGAYCTAIRSRFSTPTPCSPVRQPPTSTHSFRISAPRPRSVPDRRACWRRNRISGCMLPSPAWKTLPPPARSRPGTHLADPAQHKGRR
jgi:hypothetical protein